MDLFNTIPNDLLIHMLFFYDVLQNANAVSCALVSRRFHSAFLTARQINFNFRIHSYTSSSLLFRQRLAEKYFFSLCYIPFVDSDLTFTENPSCSVELFEYWHHVKYDEHGSTIRLKYDQVEEKLKIPQLDPISDIRSLILILIDRISQLKRIQELVEKVQVAFQKSLQHISSNCNIRIIYDPSRISSHPFYYVAFSLTFIYEDKSVSHLTRKGRKRFWCTDVEIKGRFMESHTINTLASYIKKLISTSKLEEWQDYRIIRTRRETLEDTSIVPIWE